MRLVPLPLFAAWFSLGAWPLAAAELEKTVRAPTEVQLPTYQQAALAADEPIRDLLLEPNGTVWLLGRTSIWRWAEAGSSLKRLKLGQAQQAEQDELTRLGSDGISVFAAGSGALYQAKWSQGRVFRYPLKPRAPVFGFAGYADDFWLIHAASLFQFDRYGSTLQPRGATLRLTAEDRVVYDTQRKTVWIARKNKLLRDSLDGTPPVATLTASHALLGIAKAEGELVLHTAHAVLRVAPTGKLKASIPVEGRRKLVAMDVTPAAHAYLFDDDLLEIYDVAARTTHSDRLPLDGVDEVRSLTVRGGFAALLADGRPRLFKASPAAAP